MAKRTNFYITPNEVADQLPEIGYHAYCVYGIIARCDFGDGVEIGVRKIRKRTGFGPAKINEAIQKLELLKWIEVTRLGNSTNRYRILLDAETEALPVEKREEAGALPTEKQGASQPEARRFPAGSAALPSRKQLKKKTVLRPSKDNPLDGIQWPDGMDTPESRRVLLEWLDYKRGRGQTYKSPARQLSKLLKKFATPAELVEAVDHSIGCNYAGLFPPKGKSDGRNQSTGSAVRRPSSRIR